MSFVKIFRLFYEHLDTGSLEYSFRY